MSTTEDSNRYKREDSQLTALERLLCLQSDIEGQGRRVALAVKPIAEALDNGENVTREMMSRL